MSQNNTHFLPEAFTRRIRQQFGTEADSFLAAIEKDAQTSVRINARKFSYSENKTQTVPWCSTGFFLSERPSFTLDPLFHAGAYYVQEASSMFLEQAFRQMQLPSQANVLDLCGAPGGKSTHLLSLIGDDDLLISNEVIQSRARILHENIRKWGAANALISNNDPRDFQSLSGFFDLVVVDAPCSGEGLFRRDAAARNEWSEANTQLCSVRQRRILADIWPALKTGGYLLYSTCTFNPAENEENLQWLQSQSDFETISIPISAEWNIDQIKYEGITAYRFLPHRVQGEGFFMCLIRKTEEQREFRQPKKINSSFEKLPANASTVKSWIKPGNLEMILQRDKIIALPANRKNDLLILNSLLKTVDFALPVAEMKGKDMSPSPFLAFSEKINRQSFANIELNKLDALKFLRKEEVKTENSAPGWQLVNYRNVPLGFLKNLGNRSNNYWPKEWRIRMQINETGNLWYQ